MIGIPTTKKVSTGYRFMCSSCRRTITPESLSA